MNNHIWWGILRTATFLLSVYCIMYENALAGIGYAILCLTMQVAYATDKFLEKVDEGENDD